MNIFPRIIREIILAIVSRIQTHQNGLIGYLARISQGVVYELRGILLAVLTTLSQFKVDQVPFNIQISENGSISIIAFVSSGDAFS